MSSMPRNRFVPLGAAAAVLALAVSSARAQTLVFHIDGDQPDSLLGMCVSSGFDFDGDGCDDLLVGAPAEDVNGSSDVGVVRVFSGKTHGLLLDIPGTVGSYASFGFAAALVGDVDGDGHCDVVVGAPGYNSHAGWVGAFSGATGGLLWSIYGGAGDDLGASVAAAGDVDHDGHMDVLVGAPGGNDVYLFGWGTGALHVWSSSQTGAGFGTSVSGNVDVDGDGTMDVIVGTPYYDSAIPFKTNRGRVDVYSGSTYAQVFGALGDNSGDHLGLTVCGLGDVDGDGKAEVLAGAPQAGGGAGVVREYDGATAAVKGNLTNPGSTGYGSAVARVRDMDGDGFPDFLVASAASSTSVVDLWTGHFASLAYEFQPDADSFAFGGSLASGDFDGDGSCDVVVGDAYRRIAGVPSGGVQVFKTFPARWSSYGSGWPGTLGVPSLDGGFPPAINYLTVFTLGNSCTQTTIALLFLGVAPANVQTQKGGTLLVAPLLTTVLSVPPSGLTTYGFIPNDPTLLGVSFYLQAIEADPGASKGISFTAGLEGDLGIF